MGTPLASAFALISALTWAIASHLIGKHLRELPEGERPTAMAINTLRNGFGLVAFVALAAIIGGVRPAPGAALLLMASGAMGFALGDALFFAALPRCGVQTAAMVGLVNVPIAVMMGWVWLDQALSPAVLGSMTVVLLGVGLVLTDRRGEEDARSRASGVLLALIAALFWASATISGHAAMQGINPFSGAVVRLTGALIACFGMSVVVGLARRSGVRQELRSLTEPLRRRSMFLVLLPAVLFSSVFNLVPFHYALRDLPGAIGALLFSTTPLFTLPLARYFGETVGARTLLGTLVGFAGVAGVVFLGEEAAAPAAELEVTSLAAAGSPGARWPDLALGPDGRPAVLYTLPGDRPRLELTRLGADGEWSEPETMAVGSDWFINWADFPQLAFDGGEPVVTWLENLDGGPYAYGVRLREGDAPDRWLHEDDSATEHGFVSLVPLGAGGTFATWLDGHGTADGGPMTLRAQVLGSAEFELDERVCDCCQTGAARLADGRVLVAWRDRSEGVVRDVSWSVGDPGDPTSFGAPRGLADDGWEIAGCPVNGPAVAANAQRAAVAWYTEAQDDPRVQIAWFDGADFGAPLRVDEGTPIGRVDVGFLGDELCVTWLERQGLSAAWRARLVTPEGGLGAPVTLGEVSGERTDGFLRLVTDGEQAWAAFVDREVDGVEVRHLRRQ